MVLVTLLSGALLVGRGDLDNNIGRLTDHLGLKSLLGISCVLHSADETVAVNDRIAALDHSVVAGLLAVLVVGELVVFDVKSELVRGIQLR